MFKLPRLGRFRWFGRHWSGTGMPFEVACFCGRAVQGRRSFRHQVVRCPSCQREVFVFPLSPLPPLKPPPAESLPSPAGAAPARSGQRPRRHVLVFIAALTVFGLALASIYWFSHAPTTVPLAEGPEALGRRMSAGQRALAEGHFSSAKKELGPALSILARHPQALTAKDRQHLRQLYRQADLLADLLTESLEEILRHAARLPEDEWHEVFAQRYQGRTVVFDAEVRRDAGGRYHIDYQLQVGDEPVRLELGDLKALRALPLEQPRRLLFGARLVGAGREAMAHWVVRFHPDSGVVLTDRGAVRACSGSEIDAELTRVLDQQAEWVAEQ